MTRLAALVFVSATLVGVVAGQLAGPSLASSSQAASPGAPLRDDHHPARGQRGQEHRPGAPPRTSPRLETRGEVNGANLDPALLGALRRAAADAAREGIEIVVNSGRRSPEHQERLLRDAVSKYGSTTEAARWVATADTSAHVSGHAVDIGSSRATAWLSRHGANYGLCQIYRNEPWHYELRRDAIDDGCPPMYADPRHDPRMQ